MPARLFAALFFSETGRLTAAELADRLHASPASVSTAARYQLDLHMMRREREPGSRRDVYVYDEDWYEMMISSSPLIDRGPAPLREATAVLGDSPAGRRVAEALAFLEYLADARRRMLKEWNERKRELREARRGK
ncbi:MAG: MarR family transcriptional regulator [Coriobacteriia bacterium]|nr:MarR family transcriptional regulator [Coriobacteriia bacterium]